MGYTINDLPLYSPWPARLLGLVEFKSSKKNQQEIEREFGKEKWGVLLDEIKQKKIATVAEADNYFSSNAPLLVVSRNQFQLNSFDEANRQHINTIFNYVSEFFPAKTVVELGSGYGSTILNLAKRINDPAMSYYALELTASGTECAKFLSKGIPGNFITGSCDFLSENVFDVKIPDESIIFTSFALHYIHDLPSNLITKIKKVRPKVVINFEPCFELWDNSLYGLLKKKYMIANDYSISILTSLKHYENQSEVKILNVVPDVYGQNPLLPASVLVWK
jgi:hypothetical protein